jgi:hypothetical protein
MAKRRTTAKQDQQALLWQTHPRYDEWAPTWRLLGEVAEGDGGFLDGRNLTPHPRELDYALDPTGQPDWTAPIGEKEKFKRRKRLARYENFASTILETYTSYQYAKPPARTVTGPSATDLRRWWEDVDGNGSHIDLWLKTTQALANAYGHVWVVLDRLQPHRGPVRTRAEEGPLVLRTYVPLDALDWLAPRNRLTAIKLVEAVERTSLFDPSPEAVTFPVSASDRLGLTTLQFRFLTETGWEVYDGAGDKVDFGAHAFGEVPVLPFYARTRARLPFVGRSLLGDGRLFLDHYNLLSELRELLRGNTFALLNVQLAENEEVAEARTRLGEHLGIESIAWTRGGMAYVAPPDGPAARYAEEIATVERKIYRLVGLPYEGDSFAAEAAESRRLKAMDLNRLLAGHADHAEMFEYALARKWFIATYGREAGLKRYATSDLKISHPDEFHTAAILETVDDAKAVLTLPLGRTAHRLTLIRALPVLLPDLTSEETAIVTAEIDPALDEAASLAAALAGAEPEPAEPSVEPEGEEGGGETAEGRAPTTAEVA